MNERLNSLIKLLLDDTVSVAERDDAAMDLFEFDDNRALNALIQIAKKNEENPVVLNSCGESIASIWIRRNQFDSECYKNLNKIAQAGVKGVVEYFKPEWNEFF
ncbi:hypothetical protein [Parachlamydia acanthamoebae]|uniref:hypothetical protein n=1 Tax=Parachlamydia acanthamoebae TaxID=83552 RepID=UPI0007518B1E|nr:hypothetical protein [Parachlamydia acanthamoebae]